VFFVTQTYMDAAGQPQPIWKVFWELFGASNQLLAALTLLGVTVWLWRTQRRPWVWLVTGVPAVWMYVMSSWALGAVAYGEFTSHSRGTPVAWVSVTLLVLAACMLVEAVLAICGPVRGAGGAAPQPTPAA
jgi:carbon starvation protein